MSTTGLAWALGLLAGAGGLYAIYRMHAPNTMACPSPDTLDAIVQKIRTGETSTDTAEIMAKSYDGAGCTDAAKALRITIKAHGAYLAQANGRALPDVFAMAPTEDLFDVYHLPNVPPDFLRDTVGTLLATPPTAWSDAEINVFAPQYSDKILAAFKEQGTYKAGVPLSKITVLAQLAAASNAALAARRTTTYAPEAVVAPAEGAEGSGGGAGGDFSGSFSGSGGFHL